MGVFDFLKNVIHSKPKEDETTEERIFKLNFDESVDSYMVELITERMNEYAPVLTRGNVDDPPEIFTERFNFDDVLIATVQEKYVHYLLDGINAASFIKDIVYINEFVYMANMEVEGLPDFSISKDDTAFEPYPNVKGRGWNYSKIIFPTRTPTGKQRKYPFYISWETLSDTKSGKFYYDEYGVLGKGEIYVPNPYPETGVHSYGLDFIGDKLSHVWINSEKDGKRYIYNKNDRKYQI